MNKTILTFGRAMVAWTARVFAVWAISAAALAQQQIPADTLAYLKEATVFIKVHGPLGSTSGSGFLMSARGNVGYVVTNQHVIRAAGFPAVSFVVFHSASDREREVAATVVGEDRHRDIAILRVQTEGLPVPLDLEELVSLSETLPVYILGFPFGQALSANPGNPAITVGQGAVSSIRRDRYGDVSTIQIDGDVNPGNSGGPIVTAEGSLVGVAVAEIAGTQIGLAIPAHQLQLMLVGRVGGIRFDQAKKHDHRLRIKVHAELIDPLGRMKQVSVLVAPIDEVEQTPKADAGGNWGAVAPDMTEYHLEIDGNLATGHMDLLSVDQEYWFQTKYQRGDSEVIYTQPARLPIEVAHAEDPVASPAPSVDEVEDEDDWLGSDSLSGDPSQLPRGETVTTERKLKGLMSVMIDARVYPIDVDAPQSLPQMLWSDDGRFLYLLEQSGLLRKIAVPSFREQRRLALNSGASSLSNSGEGLLITLDQLQELWVVNPDTLDVQVRMPMVADRVVSAPDLSVAFAVNGKRSVNLSIVDLVERRIVGELNARKLDVDHRNRIRKHEAGVGLMHFGMPDVTPDGRYLYCESWEGLHRFAIDGASLSYEELGPRLGSPQRIEISNDSRYVALVGGGGNRKLKDHPGLDGYGTYVYKTTNLLQPVIAIKSGPYPTAIAFDKAAERLYTANFERQLMSFSPRGVKQKEYQLTKRGDRTLQILVHPKGNRLLVLTQQALLWVELPD